MPKPNEVDAFLTEVKTEEARMDDSAFADLLDKPKVEVPVPEKEISEEDEDDTPRNRRQRRLEQKLQAEREANIALNERVKVLSELGKYAEDNKGEIDPDLIKAFGTTEDGKTLTNIFSKKFKDIEDRADQRAFERYQQEQNKVSEEEKYNSDFIDKGFEDIEDKLNMDMSGTTKSSKEFRDGLIDFIEEISPKDSNGEITEYADFVSAAKAYSRIASKDKPREVSDQQKRLADRSMTQGGVAVPEQQKGPTNFKQISRMIDSWRDQQ